VNAYELADELLRDNTQLTVTSAYMLRQQADRIADLETTLAFKRMKPLSDEEINEAYLKHGNSGWDWQIAFAREIEERHGIK
jgi:hypothetical protein